MPLFGTRDVIASYRTVPDMALPYAEASHEEKELTCNSYELFF